MNPSTFVPSAHPAVAPFCEATKERRLVLQKCISCGRLIHHPREACPHCLEHEMEWVESSGTGVIHSCSVHYRPFGSMGKDDCPYLVAFIDLDDGVRFLSDVVDADPTSVRAGDRVELTWRTAGDGYHLPLFRPETR